VVVMSTMVTTSYLRVWPAAAAAAAAVDGAELIDGVAESATPMTTARLMKCPGRRRPQTKQELAGSCCICTARQTTLYAYIIQDHG